MAILIDQRTDAVVLADPRSHAERQPLEAQAWLAANGLTFADIDAFVVLAGPGSFTGLRVGLAAVQGWAVAGSRPVAAVPTLAALAAAGPAWPGEAVVVPCVDGQRGEVFYGAVQGDTWLIEPAVAKPSDVIAHVATIAPSAPVLTLGDGAARYADHWTAAGWRLETVVRPLAEAAVLLVAAGRYTAATPHAARLHYVRRTDAEVNRERQRGSIL